MNQVAETVAECYAVGVQPHAGADAVPELLATLTTAMAGPQGRLLEIRKFALRLFAMHGLGDWTFRYNKRKRAMGLCVYQRRSIELSLFFAGRNSPEEILDTLLHEIAHALVGPKHGHDGVWKKKCVEIGARPQRCGAANMPRGKWQAGCGQCGKRFDRCQRPRVMKGWYCPCCGPRAGNLVWVAAQE